MLARARTRIRIRRRCCCSVARRRQRGDQVALAAGRAQEGVLRARGAHAQAGGAAGQQALEEVAARLERVAPGRADSLEKSNFSFIRPASASLPCSTSKPFCRSLASWMASS